MGFWTGRQPTDGYFAKPSSESRLWPYHDRNICLLEILLCLSRNSDHCNSSIKSHKGYIMQRHLPTNNNNHGFRKQFHAHVPHENAAVLGIELKHATMNHAQTIGLLDRTHASVKTLLKTGTSLETTGVNISLWLSITTTPHTMHHSVVSLHESSMVGYHLIS